MCGWHEAGTGSLVRRTWAIVGIVSMRIARKGLPSVKIGGYEWFCWGRCGTYRRGESLIYQI